MSGLAVLLVLCAAVAHASWNLFVKRAGGGGVVFVAVYTALEVVVYAPLAVIVAWLTAPAIGVAEVGFMAGSAALHTAYFVLLQRGYAVGDLSLVYPVARGLGPLIAILGAVALLGERPPLLALAGGVAVCVGVFWLGVVGSGTRLDGASSVPALGYAALTGVAIASYTLLDGQAMSSLALSPVLFLWGSNLGRLALLGPVIWQRRADVQGVWRRHRREAVGVALLSPLAYVLILWAFTMAPVSYVAPAREFSIVIGTALGTVLLREGRGVQRLPAAALVVTGVALLALA